jgi:phage terminase large subunit
VLGDFAEQADDTVFGIKEVENAQEREIEDKEIAPDDLRVIGVDVARFGSDKTVISLREGNRVRIREVFSGHATTETTGAVIRLAKEVREETRHAKVRIVVDDPGVGGGVTDQVREKLVEEKLAGEDFSVTAFNGGHTAVEEDQYPNARSELWFTVAEMIDELDLHPEDPDGANEWGEDLAADLLAPKFKLDSRGRRVVEPKEETKKRLGHSPDHGDSVLLCFAPESDEGFVGVW